MEDFLRCRLLQLALNHLGKPYKWGANGDDAFDCSGFVLYILKQLGLFPLLVDMTAQGIYSTLVNTEVKHPKLGCIAFFGKSTSEIDHCVFVLNENYIIGANGRDEKAVTIEHINYRQTKYALNDFICFCDPFLV